MVPHLFELIEHTNRSIFLTGRAGTGKTTFLQEFVQKTSKKYAVVAPTGIAAINAGGVTIHSLFGLPLTTFVPTTEFVDRNSAINIPNLLPHFKYRRDKLKLLRTLEILIVDEVSMLRCDVLDMMDWALRTARKSQQSFGGLQILFIGDLYQLPPVVKNETESTLYAYYNSPFFFEAKVCNALNLLTITLTKVYRQTDASFLQMLNAIRDNDIAGIDFELLNSRYLPEFEEESYCVQLVSHNYMADTINQQKLNSLSTKAHFYKAIIWGEFKPHLYPNEEDLKLKKGAQVMFIRNDKEGDKRFYNGKLATIVALGEDEIFVLPQGESKEIAIEREIWESKKYFINEDGKVDEEVVGGYEQFPFKLAWAVTIHKSQGLTFDKVMIDAGKSFASGQVYVALSRCRTLQGIVLKSPIVPHAIINDKRILNFQKSTEANSQIHAILQTEQYHYVCDKILRQLDISEISSEVDEWEEAINDSKVLDEEMAATYFTTVKNVLNELNGVFQKFSNSLKTKVEVYSKHLTGWDWIEEKSKGAVHFFCDKIEESVLNATQSHYAETKGTRGLKGYNEVLRKCIDTAITYLNKLKETKLFDTALFTNPAASSPRTPVAKKPTHIISFQYFEDGKTPEEIAALRNITVGTVWSHLTKMATVGVLDTQRLFSEEQIQLFETRYRAHQLKTLTEWKNVLNDSFSYDELRLLLQHYNYHKKTIQ